MNKIKIFLAEMNDVFMSFFLSLIPMALVFAALAYYPSRWAFSNDIQFAQLFVLYILFAMLQSNITVDVRTFWFKRGELPDDQDNQPNP